MKTSKINLLTNRFKMNLVVWELVGLMSIVNIFNSGYGPNTASRLEDYKFYLKTDFGKFEFK